MKTSTNWERIKQREAFVESLVASNMLDLAIEWIGDNLWVEDVFDKKVLEQWAFDNGFRKFE